MSTKAAITVLRGREEVERLWRSADYPTENVEKANAAVAFVDVPSATESPARNGRDAAASNASSMKSAWSDSN